MILKVIKRKGVHNVDQCENGCRSTNGAPRTASQIAWILGRPVYLCSRCAKEWPVMWERALAGFPDDEQEAA